MRNKQVVLLIAGISGIATGIIVSLNIPFIRQGLFYPASPVVGWISVSEIYYSRRTGRKYRDIPAEMSYAPGEQIKGGQE